MKRAAVESSASTPSAASGAGGWQARLSLGFANDGGVTRLVERSHAGPLRVQKPLYPEHPSVCHAIVLHPPGGVVGGDQLIVGGWVGSGAHAFITTPGAAKWYRAEGRPSSQDCRFEVGAGASLEWMPQETILFRAADVTLRHTVSLAADAVYVGSEILCFGRTASGEVFDAGRLAQRTSIEREGRPIWFEQGMLAGGSAAMRSPLGLAGRTVCATLIAAGKSAPAALIDALRAQAAAISGDASAVGVTQLKSVLVARYLGDSSETARRVMARTWQLLRPHLLGREAVMPRIWNT
jgi:urease accessory protein